MTRTVSSNDASVERRHQRDRKAIEAALAKAIMVAVALIFCVEVVTTAEPDTPIFQATFDVAPAADDTPLPSVADPGGRAVRVAHGTTRPDTVH